MNACPSNLLMNPDSMAIPPAYRQVFAGLASEHHRCLLIYAMKTQLSTLCSLSLLLSACGDKKDHPANASGSGSHKSVLLTTDLRPERLEPPPSDPPAASHSRVRRKAG